MPTYKYKYKKIKFSIFRRCFLCKKRTEIYKGIEYRTISDAYGPPFSLGTYIYFHIECIEKILKNPAQYMTGQIETAIEANRILENFHIQEKSYKDKTLEHRKNLIERALKSERKKIIL